MNPIWQKWWVMEALENANVEFDQIATIDADTMVKWNTPNFFNMTNRKFTIRHRRRCAKRYTKFW